MGEQSFGDDDGAWNTTGPSRKTNCGTAIVFLLHCDIFVEFCAACTPQYWGDA
jgi:hypothetical protein